jgi:acyl-CoA reductase-like NAD-dependent aldehyde dehydrogenase
VVTSAVDTKAMYVGGRIRPAGDGRTREIRNPADRSVLASVPEAGYADVDAAVAAARAGLAAWERVPPAARARMLDALSDKVAEHEGELAALESANVGKPIREAQAFDVPNAAYVLGYYASWADKLYGQTIPHSMMPVLNYTLREPVGVVAAIVPWNFPLAIATWKLAPALAAGSTVVLKPSELTPLTALRLAELADEVGFPAGVVNVLTGDGRAGQALAAHAGVDKVAFTGSTAVGRSIMAAAAPTLKKLTLECGGKSPNLVFADADLDRALDATLFGIFSNQGEVCAAGSRLLVEESIHDEFVAELTRRAGALRVGDPADVATDVGPLVSDEHHARVAGLVRSGAEAGARVCVGGEPVRVDGLAGRFYRPTVLDGVETGMRVAQEEIFGPVLSVLSFADEDDAIRLANDTIYGLMANVHSENVRRVHAVAARLKCGSVMCNLPPIPFPEAPVGGYKQSGVGKDLGPHALDGYLTTKSVLVDLAPKGQHFRWFAEEA